MHKIQPDMGLSHVGEACQSGNHRQALEAMRDSLAAAMDAAEPAVVAQIAGRLQAVLSELATLPDVEEDEVDELARNRKARRSAADLSLRPRKRRPRTELGN